MVTKMVQPSNWRRVWIDALLGKTSWSSDDQEHLLQTVWGYDYFGDDRVTVRRLREKSRTARAIKLFGYSSRSGLLLAEPRTGISYEK